jgi:hypothetical protein
MYPVNLAEKFVKIEDYWNPRLLGEVNDFAVKAVKLKGEFVWHHHDIEDEFFWWFEAHCGCASVTTTLLSAKESSLSFLME